MASLAEIRQQNPQYNKLSDQELADRLYNKFYAGKLDRAAFDQRIGLNAPPPEPTPEQRQAEYLRSYPDLTGIPLKSEEVLTQGRDYIQELPMGPLRQAHGALGNYVDAAMLGGADELLALLEAAPKLMPGGETFGGAYERELGRLEQQRRDYNALNKGQGQVATGAGVVLNPLNLIGGELIAAGKTVLPRAMRASGLGAGVGGTAGALSTEGDFTDRATGAGIGAGAGLLLGGAAQPAAELLGFGAKTGAETGRAIINTLKNQAVAKADPVEQANRLLVRALLDDSIPLKDMPQRAKDALPGQGLINLGGENVTALGRQATVAPGQGRTIARNFFDEQRAGQSDRAADALRSLEERGYFGTLETLDSTRRTAAAPLYDAAYAKPAVEQWTPRLGDLMKRPSMKAAFARAQKIAAEEGRDPMELGLTFNEAGDPVFLAGANSKGQIPSTQTMDYIKRGLDDVMQAQPRDPASGRIIMNEETRAIDRTRRELVGILREGNPEYSAALDAWAGPSHSIEVMDLGRQMFKQAGNPADTIRRFQALPPADQAYARVGFVREAINKAGNVSDGGSVYQALFNTPNKRALMEAMFPDQESFQRFARVMDAERRMFNTANTVMGGSPTSRIDAEKAALSGAENSLGMLDALRSGSVTRLIAEALQQAKNLRQGVTPPVAEALAQKLFAGSPEEMLAAISGIQGVKVPAPLTALQPGLLQFGRRTPLVPLVGQGSGAAGAAIATPKR